MAYNEACGFEYSQRCGLYDCRGNNSWYIDNSIGYPQSPSLHSGIIQSGGESGICINVTGPATINWCWCADGTSFLLGELFFSVDEQKKYICTSTEWANSSYTIRDRRNHTISWIYRKIRSYPEFLGGGWIDNLSIDFQTNRLPQVITDLNVSASPLGNTGNPLLVTINPAYLTINASNIFINSPMVHLNSTNMLTDSIGVTANSSKMEINSSNMLIDSISVTSNSSKIEINSSNMSTNIYGNIKIPKISKVNIDKILDTNDNTSPQIELLFPQNNTDYEINDSAIFKYLIHPSRNNFINKCSLCVNENEITWDMKANYDDGIVYSFNHTLDRDLLGTKKWNIRCYDNFSRMYESSEYRRINVYLNSRIINVTNETDLHNCNFSSIHDAMYYAPPRSTIIVYKKVNNEHIIINKPLNLISMSNSTIYNEDNDPEVIFIKGSNVSIKGFCLKAKGRQGQQAVKIPKDGLSNIIIANNNISEGFCAEGVKNISIISNIISHDAIEHAIRLEMCSEISINNNVITAPPRESNRVGVYLGHCNLTGKTEFVGNDISNDIIGVEICNGDYSDSFMQGLNCPNNSISNFRNLPEYNVRATCD